MQINRLSPSRKERTTDAMKIVETSIEQSMKVGDYEKPKVLEERIKSINYAVKNVNGALQGLVKLQSMWRMQKTKMRTKILSKKNVHRGYVIKELVSSEEDYVLSLAILNKTVILKSIELNLLTKDEHVRIFSEIEAIMRFNHTFCEEMKKRINKHEISVSEKNKKLINDIKDENLRVKVNSVIEKKAYIDHTLQIIFDQSLYKMIDFFRLYFIYCNNFNDSRKLLQSMKDAKHKFWGYLEPLEFTEEMSKLDLASLLVKPVQRLPKYNLLFKDLIKNTDESHPDFENINKMFNKFRELNEQNNENMNKYLKNLKLAELEKQYSKSLGFSLIDGKRVFLMEEVLSIIINDMPRPITCYFFSDMLIIGELANDGMRLVRFLTFDEKSFMRNNPDTYYFKNIFTLQGKEGGLSFMAHSSEVKKNVMSFISKSILEVVRGKSTKKTFLSEATPSSTADNHLNLVKIKLLGTVQRGYLAFKFYTIYSVNIRMQDSRSLQIYLRYSELSNLEHLIKKKHPEVSVPQLPPKNWLTSRKTKVIEFRKIVVENFLQSVFKNEILMNEKNVEEIMIILNIPYQVQMLLINPEKNKEQLHEVLEPTTLEKYGKKSVLITMVFDKVQEKELNYSHNLLVPLKQKKTLMTIDVFLPGGGSVRISIKQDTLVRDVCSEVAEKIKITSWYDFQLFVKRHEGDALRLDENEPLFKSLGLSLDRKETPERSKQGFFQSLFSGFKGAVTKELHLVFKKYYFLLDELEKSDFFLDRVKLELVSFQIFAEIFANKYMLAISDFVKICALYVYLTKGQFHPDQHLSEYIKTFIPKTKYLKKDDKFWHDEITDQWVQFTERITNVIKMNQKASEELHYSKDHMEDSTNDILMNGKCMAQLYMLEIIRKNKLYGCNLFPVKPYKKKKKVLS